MTFARDDFPHGLHIQLVLVSPGILFEKNEVGGRKIRDADPAGFQMAQAWTEIFERLAVHPREDVEVEFLNHAYRPLLEYKILRLEFARPALAPARKAIQQFAEIFRRSVNEDVHIKGQARITVEDDCQSADNREINAVSGEGDQQFFESGSNLPRLWRMIHARVF